MSSIPPADSGQIPVSPVPLHHVDALSLQLRHAKAVAAVIGAASRSSDVDNDELHWAADAVVTLLHDAIGHVAGIAKARATA